MTSFLEECFINGVNKINVITGKGLRSKNLNDPYQSSNLSILKYSVPNFIKGSDNLMKRIISIDFEAVENPSVGNFDIFLRKKK
jgi:Smr domain.